MGDGEGERERETKRGILGFETEQQRERCGRDQGGEKTDLSPRNQRPRRKAKREKGKQEQSKDSLFFF